MSDARLIQNLGRGSKLILAGAGPHTPPNGVFTHILLQAGSFKAREKGVAVGSNGGHLSDTGLYSGGVKAFIPGQTYVGNFDEITGDSSFFAIAYHAVIQ